MRTLFFSIPLISLLFVGSNIFGQQKVYGGFKLTSNYSVFTEKADGWKSQFGFGLGYFEVLELDDPINLQAEINYTSYAFSKKINIGTQSIKTTNSYQSFEIPFMAKYRVTEYFTFGIGYQFSVNTFAKSEIAVVDSDYQSKSSTNITNIKTNGFILDANHISRKYMIGFRLIKSNQNFIDPYSNINALVYIGYNIF